MNGMDYLGLAHPLFVIKDVIQRTPEGYAIGCFDDPFGPVLKKLRTVLDSGKFPAVRIQAHWSNQHKIVPVAKLKQKLPAYEKLALDFPNVKVYVSHSCEYDEPSAQEVKKRVDLIKQLAPSCIPVNSKMRGASTPGVITEHHGDTTAKPGEIISHDGINCYDIDIESWRRRNRDALIKFYWAHRFNLRELTKPGQVVPPPSQRTAKPSAEYIESVVRISQDFGFAPTPEFDADVKPVKKPTLWKSHGEESQGHDDPRENKPVFICGQKAEKAIVIDYKGKEIAQMSYGGTFGTNQHRYYSRALYGYQIGKLSKQASHTEFVFVRVGKHVYGPINPAFRAGFFR